MNVYRWRMDAIASITQVVSRDPPPSNYSFELGRMLFYQLKYRRAVMSNHRFLFTEEAHGVFSEEGKCIGCILTEPLGTCTFTSTTYNEPIFTTRDYP